MNLKFLNLNREYLKLQIILTNSDEIIEFDSSLLTSIFGKNNNEDEYEKISTKTLAKLPIYGSNYFNNTNIISSPF